MSHEHIHVPTREEILAGTSRPLPRSLYTISIVLVLVGIAAFVGGADAIEVTSFTCVACCE